MAAFCASRSRRLIVRTQQDRWNRHLYVYSLTIPVISFECRSHSDYGWTEDVFQEMEKGVS